jgi:Ca2+-binding RTX toxin-like protein
MARYSGGTSTPFTADMQAALGIMASSAIVSGYDGGGLGFVLTMSSGFRVHVYGSQLQLFAAPDGGYVLYGNATQFNVFRTGEASVYVHVDSFGTRPAYELFDTTLSLFDGADAILADGGSQTLYGYGGDDTLYGAGPGPATDRDTLYGGDGDDSFDLSLQADLAVGDDVVVGGAGMDTLLLEWSNRGDGAIISLSHFMTTPIGTEKLHFESTLGSPAQVLATPGTGLFALPGLTEVSGVNAVTAASAGTIDLSAVAIIAEDDVFRYTGTDGDDAFLAPRSFAMATDIAYEGLGGNDTLGGLATAVETLYGGAGDDTFIAGAGDSVVEGVDAGTDTLLRALTTNLTNFANIENLTLLGTVGLNATGTTGSNIIIGNGAANVLNGGGGLDTLRGGAGDDTYQMATGVTISEAANAGFDTLLTAATTTLAANLEGLVLQGTMAISGTGNAAANRITGNAAANLLDGAGGLDTLIGGVGNDTYLVTTGDVVTELAGSGTADRVRASATYVLMAGAQIEVLETTLATATTAINLTGNAFAQSIIGNAGDNALKGGLGMDTLTGGAGKGAFVFNTTLGTTNIDRITDFNHAADTIRLDNAIFTGLGTATGALTTNAFWASANGAAHDATDRILYNTKMGVLTYDSNGSTAGGTIVQFARLTLPAVLDFTDFVVI